MHLSAFELRMISRTASAIFDGREEANPSTRKLVYAALRSFHEAHSCSRDHIDC